VIQILGQSLSGLHGARWCSVLSEVAYLRRACWVLMNLVEFLMARIKKITRERWIDIQLDMVLKFWPEQKEKVELLRIDLHAENDTYCDTLDDADRAIVNRVTVALLNQGLDLEDRIDERLSQQSPD
jgi:hypothetical protein